MKRCIKRCMKSSINSASGTRRPSPKSSNFAAKRPSSSLANTSSEPLPSSLPRPASRFTFLSDISTLDRFPLEPRFEVNYQLLSLERNERLRLKVRLGGSDPIVHSVTAIWPTANWHERENFDLMGIRFEGHPELSRILMPDDWEGYPQRKDYPVEGYR